MKHINISDYKNIVILTGAGISKASGIPTFRDENGIYENKEIESMMTIEGFTMNPDKSWEYISKLKEAVINASPNPAHFALAALENKAKKLTLVTQNVDGLHQKAGSENVIELHGSILTTKCSNTKCSFPAFIDYNYYSSAPRCSICNSLLRPDIVFFHEYLGGREYLAKVALRDCDLYIAIGTSGTVAPASNFARGADYAGARTILVNISNNDNPYFHETIIGKAEDIIPELFI